MTALVIAEHDNQAVKAATLGVDFSPRLSTLRVDEPPKRVAGVKLGSTAELAAKLAALMEAA